MTAAAAAGTPDWATWLYVAAFASFMLGLRLMRRPATARHGNGLAAIGMTVAVATTLLLPGIGDWGIVAGGMIAGTAAGIPSARRVKMTAMPQMVALLNGVGGGTVALIAWIEFRRFGGDYPLEILIPSLSGGVIGSVSFWGSLVAFGKLQGILPGRPLKLPGQSLVNLGLLCVAAAGVAIIAGGVRSELLLGLMVLAASALLGAMVVLPIGGADMPVVISLLNALTGVSAAAAGMALDNVALMVGGMLVGASGTILTLQMAEAMNRSVSNIVAGGFGGGGVMTAGGDDGTDRTVRSTSAADAAIQMSYARHVIIVPGYGMAVAQAQHAVRELTRALEERGVEISFAIHPVAGRMPGHMNVLLADADVPYEQLREMAEINGEFARADVSLVIGANDVTNPAAKDRPDSPIYGMPVLNVDESGSVLVLKRSMASGFAGIENPLFYSPKTQMIFGDAKSSVQEIVAEVAAL